MVRRNTAIASYMTGTEFKLFEMLLFANCSIENLQPRSISYSCSQPIPVSNVCHRLFNLAKALQILFKNLEWYTVQLCCFPQVKFRWEASFIQLASDAMFGFHSPLFFHSTYVIQKCISMFSSQCAFAMVWSRGILK